MMLENDFVSGHFHNWKTIDVFIEKKKINNIEVNVAGFCAQALNNDNEIMSGSAADLKTEANAVIRSQYELLERVSIAEVLKTSEEHLFKFYNRFNQYQGVIEKKIVFPSSDNCEWRYSLSNGVAIHTDVNMAMEKAQAELVERDAILRSWYGETLPQEIVGAAKEIGSEVITALADRYRIKIYKFVDISPDSALNVLGVFAFPINPSKNSPMVYGLAADQVFEVAMEKSLQEMLQRLVFLEGEENEIELPPFAPSPLYHQEIFLRSAGIEELKGWLSGRHYRKKSVYPSAMPSEIYFVDLTPVAAKSFVVMKAISRNRVPLIFGKKYQSVGIKVAIESWEIHPIV
ncbi:MAG: YcaO-like family protein [Oligoflexia bacterium]|nr:YcaO-like family protein [Oligoflexia bacterium]MBF0365873.1 YcaO-like family protein [Oligoflexia bacterium]